MNKLFGLFMLTTITLSCSTLAGQHYNTAEARNKQATNYNQTLSVIATHEDSVIYNRIISACIANNRNPKQIGLTAVLVGKQFLDTPYVGATLETNGDEQLVVNLRQLDCTTFVENVIAITRCLINGHSEFNDYCQQLANIRYRNGIINHYPSRLHYFTEWLTNNQQRNNIAICSEKFGTDPFSPHVSFMSTHPDKYKQLSDTNYVNTIAETEKNINTSKLLYITKDKIDKVAPHIEDGDIIAIATSLEGLDISHVGIAIKVNNKLHLMHASSTAKKVIISDKPLSEYMAGIKSNKGILVGRIIK